MCAKSLSRVWFFVNPLTVAHQAPLSIKCSRQEYWRGLPFPFSSDLPNPGIKPGSPILQADSLPLSHHIRSNRFEKILLETSMPLKWASGTITPSTKCLYLPSNIVHTASAGSSIALMFSHLRVLPTYKFFSSWMSLHGSINGALTKKQTVFWAPWNILWCRSYYYFHITGKQ